MGPITCGCLAISWLQAHTLYFRECHLPASCKSDIIFPKTIHALFDLGANLWKNHNKHAFGATPKDQEQHKEIQLNLQITDAFLDADLLSRDDCKLLLKTPLSQLLKLPTERKRNWITTYQSCIEAPNLPSSHPTHTPPIHPFFHTPPSQ